MDSQQLIETGKTILKDLWLQEKITPGQYKKLYDLMLEIRVKAVSEWVMNRIVYPEAWKKK